MATRKQKSLMKTTRDAAVPMIPLPTPQIRITRDTIWFLWPLILDSLHHRAHNSLHPFLCKVRSHEARDAVALKHVPTVTEWMEKDGISDTVFKSSLIRSSGSNWCNLYSPPKSYTAKSHRHWHRCTLSKMLSTLRKKNALYFNWLRQYTYPRTKILSVGQDKRQLRFTRREMEMGGLLVLLMKSLLRTTLLKGALERRAKNLYNCKNQTRCEQGGKLYTMQLSW